MTPVNFSLPFTNNLRNRIKYRSPGLYQWH